MTNTTDTTDKKPPGKRKQRKAAGAVQVYKTPATLADIVYMPREFITCTLPHSDPGNVLSWSRTNGNLTLAITSGLMPRPARPTALFRARFPGLDP
jgi:hypothetical protein